MSIPSSPKIYHITHIDNLPTIIAEHCLCSDAARLEKKLNCTLVGMSTIKRRRLSRNEVKCHPGTKVGQYVPFYFCPRSIMLYILHRGNHPDITYVGGQAPIVHLQADLFQVVEWANKMGRRWAFTDRNAGTEVASFFSDIEALDRIDWSAITATDFRTSDVKEGKQAEFLVFESLPWNLIERIGVIDRNTYDQLGTFVVASDRSKLAVERAWYF